MSQGAWLSPPPSCDPCGGGEVGPELSWWELGVLPLCLWNSTVVYPSFLSSCKVHLAWDPGSNKGQRDVNFHKNWETAGVEGRGMKTIFGDLISALRWGWSLVYHIAGSDTLEQNIFNFSA